MYIGRAEGKRVTIQMVGVGPAGTGFLFASTKGSEFDSFANAGLHLTEASCEIAVGSLPNYPNVPTNSQWGDFSSSLPPQVQEQLARSPISQKLRGREGETVQIKHAVALQREKGRILRGLVGGRLLTGVGISALIERRRRGVVTYVTLDQQGRAIAESDIALLSTGAEELLDPRLAVHGDRVVLSKDILGAHPGANVTRDLLADAKRVAVIGPSHSGALIVAAALNRPQVQVDLIHRGPLRVHSPSLEQAHRDRLPVDPTELADDPQGIQPNRFKGPRGLARQILIPIIRGEEPRVSRHEGCFTEHPGVLDRADLIVQCTGLNWRAVPLFREGEARPIGFLTRQGKVLVNQDGNPHYSSGSKKNPEAAKQVFIIGMGSVGIDSSVHTRDAVNFYEGSVGEERVRSVARRLNRLNIT
ncbi:hypothetical protein A2631_05695 [Candidatus Daviesbacteria bacterium RIFCSPHIGHO2_01_FULL_44_29]|nr:MAG: hypothetical protein A2631_05695 [Candidatus Daviesbacteria bacterium RIFCSPHIGHO2_01_FULL_44_29]